jgi:hypothetical protein
VATVVSVCDSRQNGLAAAFTLGKTWRIMMYFLLCPRHRPNTSNLDAQFVTVLFGGYLTQHFAWSSGSGLG